MIKETTFMLKDGRSFKEWRKEENGFIHRDNNAAVIGYYADGEVEYKTFYINSKRHRDNKPALITYHNDGKIDEVFYFKNGNVHREDGPAYMKFVDNYIIHKEYRFEGKVFNSLKELKKFIKHTILD